MVGVSICVLRQLCAGAGEKHTVIQYDPALYQWNMTVANNPAISGVSYSDVNSLVSSNSEL